MLRPASLIERAKDSLSLTIQPDSVDVAEPVDRYSFDRGRRDYYLSADLYPLVKLPHGRTADYLETLIQMCELAQDEPDYDESVERFQEAFPSISVVAEARRRVGVLVSLGLARIDARGARLTEVGNRLLDERDLSIVQEQFMERIAGAAEVRQLAIEIPLEELRRRLRDNPPTGLSPQRYKRLDKRWQRYEKQLPGHQVQIDVKFVEPLSTATRPAVGRRTKYYQFTAIDDCTRLRVLRIYSRCDQKTAIQFVDYVLERLPFPVQVIQTDNGAEFQSAFHYHVLDKGVGHRCIKPRTPRLNGKVERSHRIDAEEFYALLDGLVIDDAKIFNNKLREWEDYYNYHRPHGGLNGQTPYERLRQKTQTQP
jgi:transposase InsO family protein